jgi:hypothetical protein
MGAHPVSSSLGLHILGPMRALASSSDSILVLVLVLVPLTSLYMYLFCNSRIHLVTLYSGQVCIVLCINASVFEHHMDLVRTEHPCFGVGCHIPHATIIDDGRLCSMGQHRSGFP